jgi:hypothetical protein
MDMSKFAPSHVAVVAFCALGKVHMLRIMLGGREIVASIVRCVRQTAELLIFDGKFLDDAATKPFQNGSPALMLFIAVFGCRASRLHSWICKPHAPSTIWHLRLCADFIRPWQYRSPFGDFISVGLADKV